MYKSKYKIKEFNGGRLQVAGTDKLYDSSTPKLSCRGQNQPNTGHKKVRNKENTQVHKALPHRRANARRHSHRRAAASPGSCH
ncbi:hypothetical protein EE612_029505 [Oryza sativa]|nr:hypothetical protein EE612_029505 [Oryza sativa]